MCVKYAITQEGVFVSQSKLKYQAMTQNMTKCWQSIKYILILLAVLLIPTSVTGLTITEDAAKFSVVTDNYTWVISKTSFNVIEDGSVSGQQKINGGGASVVFMGANLSFAAPIEFLSGSDWLEMRGWISETNNLWYVARYKFKQGTPVVHLALSMTDRHNQGVTEGHWDPFWDDRFISELNVNISSPLTFQINTYKQYNSHSGGDITAPYAEVVSASGSPYQWRHNPRTDPVFNNDYLLEHGAVGEGENQIIWYPRHQGSADLQADFTVLPWAYLRAEGVTYEINHVNGSSSVVVDQTNPPIDLGVYTLDNNSTVILKDTGSGPIQARSLLLFDNDEQLIKEMVFGERLPNDIVSQQGVSFVVNDLWQHHPVEISSSQNNMAVNTILTPTILMGGMGKTLDIVISMAGSSAAAKQMLVAPEIPQLPTWWDPIDGSLKPVVEFDNLLSSAGALIDKADEKADNFGWKNWGDYQIGNSYTIAEGPVEDWASLQVDLPTGLLLAWMRTGDEYLWTRARAAVRHMMDIDLVKFQPFRDKFAGVTHRKGACTLNKTHICQEPVFDYSFAWRSFLLYHHITGEEWAKELARMQIDNAAYIALTRESFLVEGGATRPFAWLSRALIYGEKVFPEGTKYLSSGTETSMPAGTLYRPLLDNIMTRMTNYIITNGRLPGIQPIWMGQLVESMAEYHRITGREDVKQAILIAVNYFIDNSVRIAADETTVEIVYNETTASWAEADNYGWFWVSSLVYANQISAPNPNPKFMSWADTLYQYSYANTVNNSSIRAWTSALGFPWLYVTLEDVVFRSGFESDLN